MNATLSQKLHKVTSLKTDTSDFLVAVDVISDVHTTNTIETRRNLRGEIEQKSLIIIKKFVDEMSLMNECLEAVGADLDRMGRSCEEMESRFSQAKASSLTLIERTSQIKNQCDVLTTQERIAKSFLSHFQLSESQIYHLRKEIIDDDFFLSLEKVQRIYIDCKPLLRTEHQQAGIEIMDSMSTLQESAYERLYRWVLNECKKFESDSPEISQLLQRGVKTLRHRTAFFKHCIQAMIDTRRTAVLKSFLQAQSRGNRIGDASAPLDPVRIVSDLLAWIHQAAATEHDFAILLLDARKPSRAGQSGALQRKEEEEESKDKVDREQVYEILDSIFEGVVRSFSVRVEAILSTPHISAAVIYRLSSLLGFYTSTIGGIIGIKASLCLELQRQHQLCLSYFFTSLRAVSDHVLRFPPSCPASLMAPSLVHEIMKQLDDVMQIYDGSLIPPQERATDFAPVLQALIEPLLHSIALSATGLDPIDMAAYHVNCLSVILTSLQRYDFTQSRVEMISAQIEAHLQTLVQEIAGQVLGKTALAAAIYTIQTHNKSTGPLSSVPGMDSASLTAAVAEFYKSLGRVAALSRCDKIADVNLSKATRRSIGELIVDGYRQVFDAVRDPVNNYASPSLVAPHPIASIQNFFTMESD